MLLRVETTAAFADVLLAREVGGLSVADRALATDLVYGTLAWQGRLDHHLAGLLRGTTVARLDPPVRVALRLGLYQLLFLDRVPAYAAVDASVRLARRAAPGAAGLVNAVLRRAAREGPADPSTLGPATDPLARLAVEWSHPRWLVERLAEQMPMDELPALLAAHNRPGRVAVRVNTDRVTREALAAQLEAAGVAVAPSRFAPDALVVERAAGRLRALPAFLAGHFAYQGEASQLVTLLLGLEPGARVLDACAAPGGKTLQAATSAGAAGRVLAFDPHPAGARRIVAEAKRLGTCGVGVVVADALPAAGARGLRRRPGRCAVLRTGDAPPPPRAALASPAR